MTVKAFASPAASSVSSRSTTASVFRRARRRIMSFCSSTIVSTRRTGSRESPHPRGSGSIRRSLPLARLPHLHQHSSSGKRSTNVRLRRIVSPQFPRPEREANSLSWHRKHSPLPPARAPPPLGPGSASSHSK